MSGMLERIRVAVPGDLGPGEAIALGLVAGATGKAALDITSYLDMLIRGRPASDVPARTVQRIGIAAAWRAKGLVKADLVGPDDPLTSGPGGEVDDAEEPPGPRASAGGGLAGLAIGIGLGATYGWTRARVLGRTGPFGRAPSALSRGEQLLAATVLSAAAMAASDIPAVASGATSHPREWTPIAWLSDIVPHAAYGSVTVVAFEAMLSGSWRRWRRG